MIIRNLHVRWAAEKLITEDNPSPTWGDCYSFWNEVAASLGYDLTTAELDHAATAIFDYIMTH